MLIVSVMLVNVGINSHTDLISKILIPENSAGDGENCVIAKDK